jgi:hypothetical protein
MNPARLGRCMAPLTPALSPEAGERETNHTPTLPRNGHGAGERETNYTPTPSQHQNGFRIAAIRYHSPSPNSSRRVRAGLARNPRVTR